MAKPSPKNGVVKSGGELKFPVDTPGRARNAMARLDQAKPRLTPAEKRTVARAVEKELGHPTDETNRLLRPKTSAKKPR